MNKQTITEKLQNFRKEVESYCQILIDSGYPYLVKETSKYTDATVYGRPNDLEKGSYYFWFSNHDNHIAIRTFDRNRNKVYYSINDKCCDQYMEEGYADKAIYYQDHDRCYQIDPKTAWKQVNTFLKEFKEATKLIMEMQ